jgi:ubiquitin-protein ligase
MVLPADGCEDYIWYDSLNRYCIEKNPSEKQLFARTMKYIDRQNENDIQQPKQNTIISENNFDIEYYKIKSHLTKMITTSNPTFVEQDSGDGVKSLYDKSIVANLVIDEYLNCWTWLKGLPFAKIELINNNIFSWKIMMRLKTCGDVELEIYFHSKLYPNYPPVIKIVKPHLLDSLAHRIANSKITQLSYWTPSRSVKCIVERVKTILDKWGKIDTKSTELGSNSIVLTFETYLMQLSSFIETVNDDDEIDKGEDFIKFNIAKEKQKNTFPNTQTATKKTDNKYWKSGTGYGTHGSSNWNPDEYIKLQNEKDKNIADVLNKIITELQNIDNNSPTFIQICKIISNSLLLSYLKQQFKNSTLLEMQNRENMFKLYVSLLEVLTTENSAYLLDIKNDNENLYDVLKKLYVVLQGAIKLDNTNEFMQLMMNMLEVLVFPIYDNYSTNKEKPTIIDTIITTDKVVIKDIKTNYKELMTKFRFGYSDILSTNFKSDYKAYFEKESNSGWGKCQKRLSVEIPSLIPENQLPIEYDSSIFFRVDEDNPMIMRALITGPQDTPYDSGCFIFDIYTGPKYPKESPGFWFMNHGGKRFNPNLYNSGKVCLSILGTYVGPSAGQSEQWNESTSSLLQVLVSIQSQILIEQPYFNEPGYESGIGTADGNARNVNYNANIRSYTLRSTMLDLLQNPKLYPQFEDIVKNHFRMKKDYIKKICEKWKSEAPATLMHEYKNLTTEIIKELDKL